MHFSLKIWHVVTTNVIIFLRINWPNLNFAPPNFLIFALPRGFLRHILRRRVCLWTPLFKCTTLWRRVCVTRLDYYLDDSDHGDFHDVWRRWMLTTPRNWTMLWKSCVRWRRERALSWFFQLPQSPANCLCLLPSSSSQFCVVNVTCVKETIVLNTLVTWAPHEISQHFDLDQYYNSTVKFHKFCRGKMGTLVVMMSKVLIHQYASRIFYPLTFEVTPLAMYCQHPL